MHGCSGERHLRHTRERLRAGWHKDRRDLVNPREAGRQCIEGAGTHKSLDGNADQAEAHDKKQHGQEGDAALGLGCLGRDTREGLDRRGGLPGLNLRKVDHVYKLLQINHVGRCLRVGRWLDFGSQAVAGSRSKVHLVDEEPLLIRISHGGTESGGRPVGLADGRKRVDLRIDESWPHGL